MLDLSESIPAVRSPGSISLLYTTLISAVSGPGSVPPATYYPTSYDEVYYQRPAMSYIILHGAYIGS